MSRDFKKCIEKKSLYKSSGAGGPSWRGKVETLSNPNST